VEGVVVDEKGSPVAGARVARDHAPTYVPANGAQQGMAITDGSGSFKLVDVAIGEAEIEAFASDVGRGLSAKIRIDEGRTVTHVKIVLHPVLSGGPGDDLAPGGVAITLEEEGGKVTIASVAGGSEAERAGLLEGDEIVKIDGVEVTTIAAARSRLAGPLAADVIVRVKRKGEEKDLRVVREATKH
jgi:S1-C subfamily serine protease